MHSNNIKWNDERHTPMLNNYRAIVASWIYDMNTCAPYAATALLYLCMSMQHKLPGPSYVNSSLGSDT